MSSIRDFNDDRTIAFRPPDGWNPAAPADETVHLLILLDDTPTPRRIVLDQPCCLIGRSPPADLILAGSTVSRRHCQIAMHEGQMILSDLGSTNGTFVNDVRVVDPVPLDDGAEVRIGEHRLRYQRRSQREAAEADAMERELEEASSYVAAILPAELKSGPVRAEWVYLPCSRLAGDAFGYRMLDSRYFAAFLLDVAGHGTGSALHAVSVANAIRRNILSAANLADPAAVLRALNDSFPMTQCNGLFFTIWYGVYDTQERVLRYAAGGHHPGYLMVPDSPQAEPLKAPNPAIGFMAGAPITAAEARIPPGSIVTLFSDGVFEIVDRNGRQWQLEDVVALLPNFAGPNGSARLYEHIRQAAQPGPLQDDVSILLLGFP
jgi:serine phosphatase RsbU (regulator of sigma subunit)